MSDAAASNSVSCCNTPDSSSQDDHRHHHQSQPAAKLPEYSQQPVDGIDTRAELPSVSLGGPSPTAPSQSPPPYQQPPPYTVDYTPDRGGVTEVRIPYVRQEETKSYLSYIGFACVVFWLCGFVFGAVAFILAVLARRKQEKKLADASYFVSFCGMILGVLLLCFVLPFVCCPYSDADWRDPDVTSSACLVIENDTTCFRFASSFTAELCSKVDGVIVNISSTSLSSSLPPPLAATAASTVCYHNVCAGNYLYMYIVNVSCFQHRTTLDRNRCQGINGYYVPKWSGRCYYNDRPALLPLTTSATATGSSSQRPAVNVASTKKDTASTTALHDN